MYCIKYKSTKFMFKHQMCLLQESDVQYSHLLPMDSSPSLTCPHSFSSRPLPPMAAMLGLVCPVEMSPGPVKSLIHQAKESGVEQM